MLLDVSSALRSPGEVFPLQHQETIPPQEILGETVLFDDPVVLTGTYGMVSDTTLRLKGRLAFTVHAQCARCLGPVTESFSVPFEETFERRDRVRNAAESFEDEEQMVFEGHTVDLNHLVLMLTVLELPIRFVCKDDCGAKGFITEEQLTKQANACRDPQSSEHPFAALQQLLKKDQEV